MANERVNRSPLSAREGKVYLDGVLIADTCKFQVVFKPDVWSGKQLSEPGTNRRWIGYDIEVTIEEWKTTRRYYFNSAKGKKYFTVLQGRYLKDSSLAKRGDINLNTGHHVNVTVDNGSNTGKGSTTNTTTTTTGGSGYMFSVGNVQNGSKGNDVKLLQRLLKSNGFKGKDGKNLTIDGECGTNTVYAIKTYQTKKGLSVDGCAGPATWKSILLR